jgi:hypothetical protein
MYRHALPSRPTVAIAVLALAAAAAAGSLTTRATAGGHAHAARPAARHATNAVNRADGAARDQQPTSVAELALARRTTISGPLTPMTYGAVGDGTHDDTQALQEALDAATASDPLVLPAGMVFAHSAVLYIRVPGERVEGTGELLATNEAESSVWITADNVQLDGPTLATASTTQRWSTPDQMGLTIQPSSGVLVRDVTVTGSAAAGIYVGGAQAFTLDHDRVSDTRADGIHMTDGAAYGTVLSPVTTNTGDDGISVVSYGGDSGPCHDITVEGAQVDGTTGGRGLAIVGGTRISFLGFDVQRSAAAGVYVASEGAPYYTAAPIDITVSGGTIEDANTDPTIDHGSVLVVSAQSGAAPDNVTVSDLVIVDSRSTASRDAGVISYADQPIDVVLEDFTILGGPVSAYEGNATSGYQTIGWTQNGTPLPDQN